MTGPGEGLLHGRFGLVLFEAGEGLLDALELLFGSKAEAGIALEAIGMPDAGEIFVGAGDDVEGGGLMEPEG
jgi:hypothetical protein